MASNVYEGMFILDSNRYGRDPEAVSGQIGQIIEKAGGEMLVSRLWEERRLAYSIKGQRKGTYWLTYFRLEGGRLSDAERQFRLSDSIIRHMFVKQDPRIVDALVAHAQAGEVGRGGRHDEAKAEPNKQKETAAAAPQSEGAQTPAPDDEKP